MPVAVYVLGLSVFALGTSEFMLSGLLPPIAEDLNVTIPQAGLLISAFAVGMVIGAPLLAVATLRLPRRTTLIAVSFLLGVSAFYTAPALNARMFNVAGAAPTLAGATTTAAFNLGNTGGPWLGGAVIDAGLGYPSVAWAGAAMTAAGIAAVVVAMRFHGRTGSRLVMAGGVGVRQPEGGGLWRVPPA